ncbi:hypothetical protein [Sphingobium olei]|uniref:MerR family transcriptional regulator n=1 Tax=Sphingobium olei TaxID=420955 RepID=A0ABW3NXB5_9SPHN
MSQTIDFDEPIFARDMALAMLRADETTLDNWLRHGHVVPAGPKGKRLFSPMHLIEAELIYSLANTFRVPPGIGRAIALDAIAEYRQFADADILDIWNGSGIGSLADGGAGRTVMSLVRGSDGELRAWERGDRQEDEVTLVLPTRLIARSVFAKMKVMMEAVTKKVPA